MIKKTGIYKGRSNKLGGGGRFAQVVDKVMASSPKGGLKEAQAIAAIQGRKEYGKAKFQKMATVGRLRARKGKK